MNILAFDTCLGSVSVAVHRAASRGEPSIVEVCELMQIGQAERLMPMLAAVMRDAGLHFRELDRIAVTCGPGSFTGVRVGVAAARALSLAAGVEVVAPTSLAVMAARAGELLGPPRANGLAVCVDARRGGIYLQLFDWPGGEALTPPEVLSPHEGAQRVGARRVTAVGSGAELLAQAVAAARVGEAEPTLVDLQPHARTLLSMAASLVPVAPVRPLYLRAPDAKPQPSVSPVEME
jgi:tRNA threonylcarbamoyladenosine biosynthesis protein TsaB